MLDFDEKTHTYSFNGKELVSVTELIKQHFPFEEKKIAFSLSKKTGVPVKQIISDWYKGKKIAETKGRLLHQIAEDCYNGREVTHKSPEVKQIKKFFRDHAFLSKFASEAQIYSKEWGIAGTVDLVLKDKKGALYVFDWKTSKEIKQVSYGKATYPLEDIENNNYTIYSLQLHLYKLLIEKYYNKKVKYLGIVHLRPLKSNYSLIPALPLEKQAYRLISYHQALA